MDAEFAEDELRRKKDESDYSHAELEKDLADIIDADFAEDELRRRKDECDYSHAELEKDLADIIDADLAEDELRRKEDEVRQRKIEQRDERRAEAKEKVVDEGLAGTTSLASINVTHLENNAHFVMARPEDIIAIQEHKLSANGIGEMMETFRKSGWNLMCGPAEYASKRINAGVGIASHSCNIIRGDRKSDDFENAYQLGRVDKYIIDNGGLKENIIVFVIYGKSGGSKHARGITEAIIAAIRKEMGPYCNQPVLIMGDFNAEPNSLMQAMELMEEEAWIDVGAVASWWGGIDNQPTCLQRAEVQETRIDGVLANSMAISFIRGFTVEKDPMIPTHSVVKIHLDLETVGEQRKYIKTLPSLKHMLGDKIAKETAGMEDAKEKAMKAKEIRGDLHRKLTG